MYHFFVIVCTFVKKIDFCISNKSLRMEKCIYLKQLASVVWILEELRKSGSDGLTLAELNSRMLKRTNGKEGLTRSTLTRRRKEIKRLFGVNIESPDKMHYIIMNLEHLSLDTLANDLLASVQEYLFLDTYRDLGSLIQPMEIRNGIEFLHDIGDALRYKKKLKIRYRKSPDVEAYDAVVHPYCLKASLGRWYLFGYKENNSNGKDVQSFALDRTINISVMTDSFVPNPNFDPVMYFYDSFGVWVDKEEYPVRDFTIAVTPQVANYLRTLPLHHSQREHSEKDSDGNVLFSYHISPTPDFMGALYSWGDKLKILE